MFGIHGVSEAQGVEPEGLGDSRNTGRAAGDVIQPFDRIDIRVKREPQLSDIYTVSPSGALTFPLVGAVQASGRTAEDLSRDLEQQLQAFLRRPEVTAELLAVDRTTTGLMEPGPQVGGYSVYITGAVDTPGVYYLREPTNVLQLMVRAGGFENLRLSRDSDQGYFEEQVLFPDLESISIVGNSGQVRFVNLSMLGQRDVNMEILDPGDTVIVRGHHGGTFAVYGWVNSPGVYPLHQPILLTEALAHANPIRQYADLTKVKILRGDRENPEAFTVNLDKLHSTKTVDPLPVIQPGDTIYVPRNFYSRWLDFVDGIRGARNVTEDIEEMRDHWTLRDIRQD
jgi:protein involved in polysaccharide export with SLBB domain